MSSEKLENALLELDCENNIHKFLKDTDSISKMHHCHEKLAIWSKQFESVDKENPALSFIREMQTVAYDAR